MKRIDIEVAFMPYRRKLQNMQSVAGGPGIAFNQNTYLRRAFLGAEVYSLREKFTL